MSRAQSSQARAAPIPQLKKPWLVQAIESRWYASPGWLYGLLPLEFLFRFISILRKGFLHRRRWHSTLPVIIIGNISVGGTGKTPVLIALIKHLQAAGFHPGVISRGYGRSFGKLCVVSPQSSASEVGDEPLEIVNQTACPVVVSSSRVEAAQYLQQHQLCTVIVADDGLQHYRLGRNIEIAVVDGEAGFGNGHCLPVGPLREPVSRLASVHYVLASGRVAACPSAYLFDVQPKWLVNVKTGTKESLQFLRALRSPIAVAGIGKPDKLFNTLKRVLFDKGGGTLECYGFADHHAFSLKDFEFAGNRPVIMTAKDAVKCVAFAQKNWWYLSVEAKLSDEFLQVLLTDIKQAAT